MSRRQKQPVDEPSEDEASYHGPSSVVNSGSDSELDFTRGLAQRSTEPYYRQIREKGPHTFQKQAFEEGRSFYPKDEEQRLREEAEMADDGPVRDESPDIRGSRRDSGRDRRDDPRDSRRRDDDARDSRRRDDDPRDSRRREDRDDDPRDSRRRDDREDDPRDSQRRDDREGDPRDSRRRDDRDDRDDPRASRRDDPRDSRRRDDREGDPRDSRRDSRDDPRASRRDDHDRDRDDDPRESRRRDDDEDRGRRRDEDERDMRRDDDRRDDERRRSRGDEDRDPRDRRGDDRGRRDDDRVRFESPENEARRSNVGRPPRDDRDRRGDDRGVRGSRPPRPGPMVDDPRFAPEKLRPFEGDLSGWGQDADDMEHDDASIPSLSSGLSPRAGRPREREWNGESAKRALGYNAGLFSRAQTLRKEGRSPMAMGIADDLPTRMAFEQLNQLSGMAGKVQAAVEHNRRVFEKRVDAADKLLKQRVIEAWRAVRYGSIAKQNKLRKAIARIARGTLTRAFLAWKEKFHMVDANLRMKRKVGATIARGRMKRCFLEWRRLAVERWWKNQVSGREEEIAAMAKKIRGFERRPIVVLAKRRLQLIMDRWFDASEGRRRRRRNRERALMHLKNQQYLKAWNSWYEWFSERTRQKRMLRKALKRMTHLRTAQAWDSWWLLVEARREKEAKTKKAILFWQKGALSKGWNSWLSYVEWKREKRKIMRRWMAPHMAKAFYAWLERTDWQKRMKLVLQRAARRLKYGSMALAFELWVTVVQDSKDVNVQKRLADLEAENERLVGENKQLREDNYRFIRLIDSGEWGRGRVSELVSAGKILQGERDALMKLVGSLRKEHEDLAKARMAQEDELRSLKNKMLLGGAARNRMLVKGGSAFNALTRALKQDLIESGGPAAQDPNVLYGIDKLSMQRVNVYPDGELNVQAVREAPNSAAFIRPAGGRPASAGAGPPRPFRTPQGLQGISTRQPPPPQGRMSGGRSRTTAGGMARPGGPAPGSEIAQRVIASMQGLSPQETDVLERAILQARQDREGSGGRGPPAGPGPSTSRGEAGLNSTR